MSTTVRVLIAVLPPGAPPEHATERLSLTEREQAGRLRAPQRRAQFTAARLMASRVLGVDGSRIAPVVVRDERGRPGYDAPYGHTRLSISHSGSVVAVACGECELGVDVEQLREIPYATELARRVLNPACARAVAAAAPTDRSALFLTAWTRLEAAAKASGADLPSLFGRDPAAYRHVRELPVAAGYVGALATDRSDVARELDAVEVW